jgi:aldose 1-epimerase
LPFGYGAHPYLTVGESTVDEVALTVPAASYLEVDDDRLLPLKLSPVRERPTTSARAAFSAR